MERPRTGHRSIVTFSGRSRSPWARRGTPARRPLADILAIVLAMLVGAAIGVFIWTGKDRIAATISLNDDTIASASVGVTDGDTVSIRGRATRLVGFNAPESFEPACANERALGLRARARLEEMVAAGNLSFQNVSCACRAGTEGTSDYNYGRACGRLYADGRDVGAILIAEGLAVPYTCGVTGCPPRPVPWC